MESKRKREEPWGAWNLVVNIIRLVVDVARLVPGAPSRKRERRPPAVAWRPPSGSAAAPSPNTYHKFPRFTAHMRVQILFLSRRIY